MKTRYVLPFLFVFIAISGYSQDSLFLKLANEHLSYMANNASGAFSGKGWDLIRERSRNSQQVLIGEDHFTKEIPQFIEAVGLDSKYDNFYIEVDPYTTALLYKSLAGDESNREEFVEKYGSILSFYSLAEEYSLLKKLVEAGMHVLGSDQIVMYDDRLVFDDLAKKTQNKEAEKVYRYVSKQSEKYFNQFLGNPQANSMYMMTPDFKDQLTKLQQLNLSAHENDIIDKLLISADIYATQSHRKRVQLLKHHFMNDNYEQWKGKRTLFKYGANHMARGESFLTVTDIGNLVANIAEANYESSLHIMVLGENGMQASAFKTFPATPIDPDGFYLKHLQPFFTLTNDSQWAVFDLVPLRKELEKGKLSTENKNLKRTIKGFDILVLIPEVTAASFEGN